VLAYPYDWRGFVKVKQKTSMGLSVFIFFSFAQRRGRGRGLHPLLRPPGAQPGTSLTFSQTYTPSPSQPAVRYTLCSTLQSRQSTRLFLQSSELGPPPPPPLRRRVLGVRHTCLLERGGGGSQFRRGDRHCGTLGIICTSCSRCSTTKENIAHRKQSKILSVLKIIF
jgi:hypothetical protein